MVLLRGELNKYVETGIIQLKMQQLQPSQRTAQSRHTFRRKRNCLGILSAPNLRRLHNTSWPASFENTQAFISTVRPCRAADSVSEARK